MGDCMLLSSTDYARSKKKAKLTNNKGKQNKPKQIKCENESQYKELIVDKTRAISRAIAVLFIYFFKFFFFKAFAEENGFVGELKHWDIPFWSQKQREHLFRFEQGTSYVVLFCLSQKRLTSVFITVMSRMLVVKLVLAQAWREFSRFSALLKLPCISNSTPI